MAAINFKAGAMHPVPELMGLPSILDTIMKPWIEAIQSAGLGMSTIVASAAISTAFNLKRRVVVTSGISGSLAEARGASQDLAQKLDQQIVADDERRIALAALALLIDKLRHAEPSESTRALGLGW